MNPDDRNPSRIDFILLLLAAFLAPLVGGHVSVDPRPIELGLVGEIFGGGSLPYLARLLIGLLILGGLAVMAIRNRVIQLPNIRIIGALTFLVLVLGFSITLSDFKYVAFGEWLTWFIYGGALFLAIGTIGRSRGPVSLASALCAGIAIAAILGIREYSLRMAIEPGYRIFAGWNNPNAAASMFVVGSILPLGLVAKFKTWQRAFPIIATALSLTALVLTQSKGGYLACGLALLTYLAVQIIGRSTFKTAVSTLSGLALGATIVFGITQMAANASQGQALGRITGSGAMVEQSVGFRQNLWKSALEIAIKHPVGTGPGTFRFHSAEPGLTEFTVFAHQSYLQLAVEGGWLALLLFLALAGYWLSYVFRGIKQQPSDVVTFRASAIAATFGLAAHSMIDSDLSFLGSGLALFLLVALTIQLSTDGSSPEAVPRKIRLITVSLSCLLPILGLTIYAAGEAQKATLMTALSSGKQDQIQSALTPLRANPYGDPEATYLASMYGSTSVEERLTGLQKVVSKMPQGRVIRATARTLADAEKLDEAIAVNERVFKYDPNNLRAHWLKVELLKQKGAMQEAQNAARDVIAVESQTSYKTRAIPELIPTETFEARLFLAESTKDPAQKSTLLAEALLGFQRYFEVTAPLVKKMTAAGLPDYGGEGRDDVARKQQMALRALNEYTSLYGDSGELSGETVIAISKGLEFSF